MNSLLFLFLIISVNLSQQQTLPENSPGNVNPGSLFNNPLSVLRNRLQEYNVSAPCIEDNSLLWEGLANREMWAMQMLDASGKLPTGVLQGNMVWLGSFDECTNITVVLTEGQLSNRTISDPYGVQYCRVSLPLPAALQGNGANNPFLGLAGGGSFSAGVCIPKSCSSRDAPGLLATAFSSIPMVGSQLAPYNITDEMHQRTVCQKEPPLLDAKAKAAIAVIVLFVVLFIIGTTYDVVLIFREGDLEKSKTDGAGNKQSPPTRSTLERVLLSFSIYTNVGKMLNTKQGSGTLTAVNGIRFFSMSWVVIGHSFPQYIGATGNPVVYFNLLRRFTFQTIANATVSTDSFFVLSGLLVGYLSFKEMKKLSGLKSWIYYYAYYYFHRYWRLTPVYMLLILIYVSLWPYWGDGPLWLRYAPEPNQCRTAWWKGMLYINNFFPEDQCIGWVWYLANDMQMYWFSPFILTPLFFSPIIGGVVVCLCLIATSITAGLISYHYNIPGQIVGAENTGPWFNYYYIKPYCRIGPYIIGLVTGYILHRTNCQYKLKMHWNLLGWAAATVLCLSVLYGTNEVFQGHPFTNEVSALYNALHRTVWGVGLCWLIFACVTGNGGPINTFLSWSAFVPLSRLTYCSYMIHLIVMSYHFSTRRANYYWTDIDAVYDFLGSLVLSMMGAFGLSVAFEAPMLGLEKALIVPHLKHKKRK